MKTTKKDNRTIQQVEKAVIAMRKKVAAAVKRHAKLQARIAKLQAEGRIIEMDKDAEIVAGDHCHYVRAESLNVAGGNYYYEVTFDDLLQAYNCTCESLKPCKHITKLSESFAQAEEELSKAEKFAALMKKYDYRHQITSVKIGDTTIVTTKDAMPNAIKHHEWMREMAAICHEDPAEIAETQARLQREADAMIEQAWNKYEVSPELRKAGAFSILR